MTSIRHNGGVNGAASRGDQRGTKPQLEAACVARRIERFASSVRKRRVSESCRWPDYRLLMLELGCGFLVDCGERPPSISPRGLARRSTPEILKPIRARRSASAKLCPRRAPSLSTTAQSSAPSPLLHIQPGAVLDPERVLVGSRP